MGVGHAANRWPAIVLAGAAHCAAVLALLALTRTQILPPISEAQPMLVTFFTPHDSRPDRPASGNPDLYKQKRERNGLTPIRP